MKVACITNAILVVGAGCGLLLMVTGTHAAVLWPEEDTLKEFCATNSGSLGPWLTENLSAEQKADFMAEHFPEPTKPEKIRELRAIRRKQLRMGENALAAATKARIDELLSGPERPIE